MIKFVHNVLEVVPGTLADYQKLSEYHYRTEEIRPATSIYKVKARYPHHKAFPDPIAVVVYRTPIPFLRARDRATNDYFRTPETRSKKLRLINQKVRYLARLIVLPQFRRLGIGTKLVSETLSLQTVPIIETLTPIDFTNHLFKKCGFKIHYIEASTGYRRFTQFLVSIGLIDWNTLLPSTLQHRLESLANSESVRAEHEIRTFLKHFQRRYNMPPGLERCKYLLSKLPASQAYLIWFNPKIPLTS